MDLGLVIPELEESYQMGKFYIIVETLLKAEVHEIEAHASFLLDKKEKKLLGLKEELEKSDIVISSVHAPFGNDNDLSSPNSRIRKRTINQHIDTMKQMNLVKASILTIHPGSRLEKESEILLREELFKKSLETLLKEAEHLNIKLAVENMLPTHPTYRIETLKEILDEFPSPFLGVCFDTGHANVGEGVHPVRNRSPLGDRTEMSKAIPISNGVIETFNAIKEKVFDFHIHDNDGTRDMHLQPPYGNINWKGFFTAVENIGFRRPLMIESFPWQGRELSWMIKEVRMLKDNKILIKECLQTLNRTCSGLGQPHFLRCAKCNHFIYGIESNPMCYCNPPT